jgi:hypothetical protein
MKNDRPEPFTRLDWKRFSRFSAVGDLRRPQAPALGFTPAQARAKGQALWTPFPLHWLSRLAPFPQHGKAIEAFDVGIGILQGALAL